MPRRATRYGGAALVNARGREKVAVERHFLFVAVEPDSRERTGPHCVAAGPVVLPARSVLLQTGVRPASWRAHPPCEGRLPRMPIWVDVDAAPMRRFGLTERSSCAVSLHRKDRCPRFRRAPVFCRPRPGGSRPRTASETYAPFPAPFRPTPRSQTAARRHHRFVGFAGGRLGGHSLLTDGGGGRAGPGPAARAGRFQPAHHRQSAAQRADAAAVRAQGRAGVLVLHHRGRGRRERPFPTVGPGAYV